MNKRLVFIVEGDCERILVEKQIIPFLYGFPESKGWAFEARKVSTNRKLNAKGGIISFEYLQNEIQRTSAQHSPWITTFIDYFRLPNDFPGYSKNSSEIPGIESALREAVNYSGFIPYIQKHEFETLLFADISLFKYLCVNEKEFRQIERIAQAYPQIEDINGGAETAPSKRLNSIFPYHKTLVSNLLMDEIRMDILMERSPHFKEWITLLIKLIQSTR